jgi:hypothetical protein
MYDARKILPGLAIFLAIATLPLWLNAARGAEARPPEIVKPSGTELCVFDQATMRREHMQLLMTWRDDVVRTGQRTMVTTDGRRIRKSLTGSCLGCHADKKGSCDRCHEHLSVQPYCWDCHVEKGAGR